MNVLFIHPNMPGQFKHLCAEMAKDPKNTVVFISKPRPNVSIEGVHKVEYKMPREPSGHTHRYLIGLERSILQGQEVWRMCKKLKEDEGFVPDVIVTHPGWGDALYVKDIFPKTPVLGFFEFFYHTEGADINFDPSESAIEDDFARVRTKNATNLFSLQYCDWGVSPTHWQGGLHPKDYHHRISIIHDGIDTDFVKPSTEPLTVTLPNGVKLEKGKHEIVTYVARNFEPYRGFPTFMRAAEIIQRERPEAHILAIGKDGVSYGKKPPAGKTYREMWMDEVSLDKERIHFLGGLPYDQFLHVLKLSSAHIYLTYPFVLSWSALEAMACECLVIASKTPPVQEVIEDGVNGWMVDFFSPEQLAAKVIEALENQDAMQPIRKAARQTVIDKYALKDLMPLQIGLIKDLAAGKLPPPTAQLIDKLPANVNRSPSVSEWSPQAFVDPMLSHVA